MQRQGAMTILLLFAACFTGTDALYYGNKGFLSSDSVMQPQVVAHTLGLVSDEWRAEAQAYRECNSTEEDSRECSSAAVAFHKSCSTIINAVVEASTGDKSRVVEYMDDVCGEHELQGWRQQSCHTLASVITDSMTADAYDNREKLNGEALCGSFWSSFEEHEKSWAQEEAAERVAEDERRAKEKAEEEKRAAQEAAEEQRRREEKEAAVAAAAKQQEEEEAQLLAQQRAQQNATEALNGTMTQSAHEVEQPNGTVAGNTSSTNQANHTSSK